MSDLLTDRESALLLDLYSAEDLGDFFTVVATALRERFDRTEFAIHLVDRRRKRFLEYESVAGFGAQSDLQEYPLQVHGGELGVLAVAGDVESPDEDLASYCSHLALGLYFHKFIDQQGQLIDESLAHVQALKAMGELLGELDQELVLNKTLKFFVDLLDADVGGAVLLEGDKNIASARWGLPEELFNDLLSSTVESTRNGDEGCTERVSLPRDRGDGFSLGSILRLRIDLKQPHSVQIFLVSGDHLEVGAHQQDLMRSCRVIGGIALQKALDHQEQIRQHRLREQLEVAKQIQIKLLPDALPQCERLDMAGLSRPAQDVGGDYYDVVELEGGDLMAIVADVSGKGIQAAIRMAGLQAMTHSLGFQDLGPGAVLSHLNHFLGTGRLRGHFITACCLRFPADGGSVRLASAGHEPIIFARPGQEPRLVEEVGGLPLGLRDSQEYEEIDLDLNDGDQLLVYTDGITDIRNESGELFGTERMVESIAAAGDADAQSFLDSLVAELEIYRGDRAWPDDLTALTIHYRAEGKN